MPTPILPFDSLPRVLAVQEILGVIAEHTTKTDRSNVGRAARSSYNDDFPDEQPALFLGVHVPGRNRFVSFKIDVIDRPEIDTLPEGRAVLRVRSKEFGEQYFIVPPKSTQLRTWRRIANLKTGEMATDSFSDVWNITMTGRKDGPRRGEAGLYGEPTAVWVLPVDKLKA